MAKNTDVWRLRCTFAACVLAMAATAALPRNAAAVSYTFTNLGDVPNDLNGGQGINNNGEVVGTLGNLPAYSLGGAPLTSFGSTSNPATTAFAVNDGGIIVGGGFFDSSVASAFHTTTSSHTPINLPTSFGTADAGLTTGGTDAATAVNGNATVYTVVGRSSLSSGETRAFSWTPGASTLTLIGSGSGTDTGLGGSGAGAQSTAQGINSLGSIVGQATITGNTANHAFVYSGSHMYDLGTQSGSGDSIANAINSSGVIVGQTDADTGGEEAFIYNGYQGHLPTITGDPDTQIINNNYWTLLDLGGEEGEALSINSSGMVVGDSNTVDGASHAFLYSGGTLYDLNDIVSNLDGYTLDSATGINDAGQITGIADDGTSDGTEYAFLLTVSPIPEPTSGAIVLGSIALLSTRRRRLKIG